MPHQIHEANENCHDTAMQTRLHTSSNINMLPVELLLEIFVQDTELHMPPDLNLPEDTYPMWYESDPSRTIRRVSHVCQYWRGLVLNAPYIWSRLIDCDLLPHLWFQEIVCHACNAPLTVLFRKLSSRRTPCWLAEQSIEWDSQVERTNSNLEHLLASEKHFKVFCADFDTRNIRPTIINCLTTRLQQPMPLLTTFLLSDTKKPMRIRMANLFGGKVPSLLRHFSLLRRFKTIPPPFFGTLTYLRLFDLGVNVCSMLSQTPQLQSLDLTIMRSLTVPSEFGPSKRIAVPYLTRLSLSGSYESIALLLDVLLPAELRVLACTAFLYGGIEAAPIPYANTFQRLLSPPCYYQEPSSSKMVIYLEFSVPVFSTITTAQGHEFFLSTGPTKKRPQFPSRDIFIYLASYRSLIPTCTHLLINEVYTCIPSWTENEADIDPLLELVRLAENAQFVQFQLVTKTRILGVLKAEGILPLMRELQLYPGLIDNPEDLLIFDGIEDLLRRRQSAGRSLPDLRLEIGEEGNEDFIVSVKDRASSLRSTYGIEVVID